MYRRAKAGQYYSMSDENLQQTEKWLKPGCAQHMKDCPRTQRIRAASCPRTKGG